MNILNCSPGSSPIPDFLKKQKNLSLVNNLGRKKRQEEAEVPVPAKSEAPTSRENAFYVAPWSVTDLSPGNAAAMVTDIFLGS